MHIFIARIRISVEFAPSLLLFLCLRVYARHAVRWEFHGWLYRHTHTQPAPEQHTAKVEAVSTAHKIAYLLCSNISSSTVSLSLCLNMSLHKLIIKCLIAPDRSRLCAQQIILYPTLCICIVWSSVMCYICVCKCFV